MNNKDILKKIDLFKSLDDRALAGLYKDSVYKALEPKEILFNEGFAGSYFYILIIGRMRVFKTSFDGKESTIKIIHPGEMLAEAILFEKKEYPASAAAVEISEIVGIHRNSFWEMMNSANSRDTFLRSIFEKLRFLTEQIHYLSSHDVEDRFFKFLSDSYGKKNQYDVSIPKKDIASAIGTIPETLSRLILRLTKNGTIKWDKNNLVIKEGFWEKDYLD